MANSLEEQTFIKQLGHRIVTLRKAKNLKQLDLAAAINMEDSALRRIENGRTNPTLKTLQRIATGLDITVASLLNF